MITVEAEREKYRRMWTEVEGYRSRSPGELLVPTFLEMADWQPGDYVIDVGCGPGRAGLRLKEAGFHVVLMDITRTAPDPEARKLPFVEGCIWEAPTFFKHQWVYCCDVLEHIPPEHVDKALDNLSTMGTKGAFLQIALWAEGWGNYIGETLHLTVESADWWKAKIETRWSDCKYRDSGDGRLICLTGAPL